MIWPVLYATGVLFAAHGGSHNTDGSKALALVDEGRRLMASGDYTAACAKFASSEELEASAATALSLAACYEKAGKLVSALDAYRKADAAAGSARQKNRSAFAKKKAATLVPTLSRLTITVPASSQVVGLEVRLAGETLPQAQWGVPIPRDGGSYEVQATAPGKSTWTTHVDLQTSRQNLNVDVPTLDDATPAPSAATAPEPAPAAETPKADEEHPGRTQRVIAIVVGGAGVATMGAGGVVGLLAKSQMNTARSEANPAAHNDSVSAVNMGNLGTILVGVGAAVTAAGAVVWLTAPDSKVSVGTSGSAVLVSGSF